MFLKENKNRIITLLENLWEACFPKSREYPYVFVSYTHADKQPIKIKKATYFFNNIENARTTLGATLITKEGFPEKRESKLFQKYIKLKGLQENLAEKSLEL